MYQIERVGLVGVEGIGRIGGLEVISRLLGVGGLGEVVGLE